MSFPRKRESRISAMNQYYLYILASKRNGTLYTGITNNLVRRINEHKTKSIPGFSQKYNVSMLVYFETYNDIHDAITREKRIKKWRRKWKISLIEQLNPDWKDLFNEI